MSIRAKTTSQAAHVMQLQKELADLKQAATATTLVDSVSTESTASETTPSFDSLSHTEKAAASLGVHPQAWKPIGFINNAHYEQLMKSNALDETLARRIEAYRVVASTD